MTLRILLLLARCLIRQSWENICRTFLKRHISPAHNQQLASNPWSQRHTILSVAKGVMPVMGDAAASALRRQSPSDNIWINADERCVEDAI
jgi:hypothetical protein